MRATKSQDWKMGYSSYSTCVASSLKVQLLLIYSQRKSNWCTQGNWLLHGQDSWTLKQWQTRASIFSFVQLSANLQCTSQTIWCCHFGEPHRLLISRNFNSAVKILIYILSSHFCIFRPTYPTLLDHNFYTWIAPFRELSTLHKCSKQFSLALRIYLKSYIVPLTAVLLWVLLQSLIGTAFYTVPHTSKQ